MPPRERGRQYATECALLTAQLLSLAGESKSVLLELGSALSQRYRNGAPDHPTQQLLRRKNEVVNRLRSFMNAPSFGDAGEEAQQDAYEDQQSMIDRLEDQQTMIDRLEKQLQDQSAAFELERRRLTQQLTRAPLKAQTELDSSLKRVLPQLRELLDAYDREQGQYAGRTQKQSVKVRGQPSNQEITQRLKEMQAMFDAERADLLEQADEAVNAQRDISQENLSEREAALTCPISLDLFEDPVVTTCCGKTFSSGVLRQALRRHNYCPFCRAHNVSTHANRDMANLVELHRTERSVLGLPETVATGVATVATEISAEEDRIRRHSNVLQRLEDAHQSLEGGQPRSDISHRSSVVDPFGFPRGGAVYYDSDY